MKLKVFSVYDEKAQAYANPFQFSHIGQALRAFATAVNDPNSYINKYPSDYKLYYIADYDDITASYLNNPNPQLISHASDLIQDAKYKTSEVLNAQN